MQIEWLDILLIVGVIQGIFLIVSLQKIKDRNVAANQTLSLFLGMAIVMLIGRFLFARDLGRWVVQVSLFIDVFIFLFGPISYLYIKRMTTSDPAGIKLRFIHFVPAILHELFAIYSASYPLNDYIALLKSGYWYPYYYTISAIAILLNLTYFVFSLRNLIEYQRRADQELSYEQSLTKYLKAYLLAMLIGILMWGASFANMIIFGDSLPFINYETVWTMLSLFTYLVGYFSLTMPDLFRFSKPPQVEVSEPQSYDRLSEEEVGTITKQIEEIFRTQKIYRNPNLSLRDLSNAVGLKTNDLSWVLNNKLEQSFYDYINAYRIDDFLERVRNDEHKMHTLLSLSYESGFNAKSTFNKAFKKNKGVTPSVYIRSLNNSVLKSIAVPK